MGCKCCKMIQSYLFDAVQVPSPDYVNEVSSSKLDDDRTVKLQGDSSSGVWVHKQTLWSAGLGRTESGGGQAGWQEPQGPRPQGYPDSGLRAKPAGTTNGIGPSGASPQPHTGDTDSGASTADGVHPAQPFLEGRDPGGQDCVPPASREAPAAAETPVYESQGPVLQLPVPDYPQLWGPAADGEAQEERDCLFEHHMEDEPLAEIHPTMGEYELSLPFPLKRESLSEPAAAEVLSVYFREKGPAHAVPVASPRSKQSEAQDSKGNSEEEEEVDEDEAVAEALAALEAATAGEDVDEAD
ncbi:uncharacterized protein C4orf19 homolog [Octodon degus]|uniref:Uncharacterized protein C4orf19 homolog n=1 Tax=Octodon degus TaxID=10160 RepID=A0A6P3FQY9_OCTDE|nr:uncharacterized protein C4orf19 homolog [Octodon degus]XP_023558497.1 uncharacterized protein C4orf19 homolog [Octodon degus]